MTIENFIQDIERKLGYKTDVEFDITECTAYITVITSTAIPEIELDKAISILNKIQNIAKKHTDLEVYFKEFSMYHGIILLKVVEKNCEY